VFCDSGSVLIGSKLVDDTCFGDPVGKIWRSLFLLFKLIW